MRSHGEGKGPQGFGRRAESTKLRFYENDSRGRIGAGAGRGRSTKDYDTSDPYGRDQRGGSGGGSGDRHRSKSSDRRGKGRDINEDVLRARRKVSGAGARRSETPPRRQDEGRRSGSPAAGAARPKPSPAAGTSLTPTKGRGPVSEQPSGGTSDGNAARGRETQGHPPPLAGNALSSAYDHVPMPTSSLDFHHGMGGDDLFSSLEDQLSDPALRGISPSVASPLRRSSRSSSVTSPTRGNSIASPAKTGGAGGGGRAAAVAPTPAASVTSTFSSPEPAPTATMDTPEKTRAAERLGSDIAPMDGSRTQCEEEQEDNGSKEGTDSQRKAPLSPPPPPPPPPPLPAAPEEPPAQSTNTAAAEGVGLSVASSPSALQPQDDAAVCSSALGVQTADGGVERDEAADESPEARAADKESAKHDSTASSTVEGADGDGAPRVKEATSSPTGEAAGLPAAGGDGDDGGAHRGNMEAGPESVSHKATADKGGAEEEEKQKKEEQEGAPLDEEGEKEGDEAEEKEETAAEGKENPCGLTEPSFPLKHNWYAEGTMVILDCPHDAKTGAYHPTLSKEEMRGRLVSGSVELCCGGARFFSKSICDVRAKYEFFADAFAMKRHVHTFPPSAANDASTVLLVLNRKHNGNS